MGLYHWSSLSNMIWPQWAYQIHFLQYRHIDHFENAFGPTNLHYYYYGTGNHLVRTLVYFWFSCTGHHFLQFSTDTIVMWRAVINVFALYTTDEITLNMCFIHRDVCECRFHYYAARGTDNYALRKEIASLFNHSSPESHFPHWYCIRSWC